MSEYLLKPPGKRCVATGRPLRPGGECRSALVDRDGDPVRLDYHVEAWTAPPDEEVIGYWHCHIPGRPPAADAAPDPSELHRRFVAVDDGGTEEQERLRYWLAVELIRARRLELEGAEELGYGDGPTRTLLLTDADSGDRFRVVDFAMTRAELTAYRVAMADEQPADEEPADDAEATDHRSPAEVPA